MTIRSPNPNQPPKSSTFSRRLRNRVDQGLCIQPPQLPHSRPSHSHRAALLSSTRHISVSYPSEDTQTVWDPSLNQDQPFVLPFSLSSLSPNRQLTIFRLSIWVKLFVPCQLYFAKSDLYSSHRHPANKGLETILGQYEGETFSEDK